MIVEVKPLPVLKWHGKKGKESFTQSKKSEVLYDPDTGKYATGLTEEEAAEYGKRLGLDLTDTFIPEQPHPYWSTKGASIVLENKTMFFDTKKPLDFIKVKNMKASKLVANSMKEWEAGLWPFATHVIYDEQEDMSIKASAVQTKQLCYSTLAKLSADEKANIVLIVLEESVKGRSSDFIDTRIDEVINQFPDEFLKWAKMDTTELNVRASILEGIQRNVLTKEGQSIYYMSERLGFDLEDTIKWFANPDNQKLKVAILEKMTA